MREPCDSNRRAGESQGFFGGKCFNCGEVGHIQSKCPKPRKDKPGGGTRSQGNEKKYHASSFAFSADFGCKAWIVDSGASSHMSNDLSVFQNYRAIHPAEDVYLGDDRIVRGYGTGTVVLGVSSENEKNEVTLSDVLYVPKLGKNLLSVGTLEDKGATVLFKDKKVTLTYRGNSMTLATAKSKMYVVNVSSQRAVRRMSLRLALEMSRYPDFSRYRYRYRYWSTGTGIGTGTGT